MKEINKPKTKTEGLRNFVAMIINSLERGDAKEALLLATDLWNDIGGAYQLRDDPLGREHPRPVTAREREKLIAFFMERERVDRDRAYVEGEHIAVFGRYISDGPGFAGKVFSIVWPGGPELFDVVTEGADGSLSLSPRDTSTGAAPVLSEEQKYGGNDYTAQLDYLAMKGAPHVFIANTWLLEEQFGMIHSEAGYVVKKWLKRRSDAEKH